MTSTSASRREPMPPLSVRAWLRYDVVDRIVSGLEPQSLLEIGCGQGAFGARLAPRTSYLGVEPDDTSFTVAQSRISRRGGTVLHGTHTIVPENSTYDVVCAFEVLEHLEDDAAALADWVELVRPSGHLLLSVPAFQEKFGAWDTLAGHFRRYSPEEIRERLTDAGLEDVRVTLYGWPIAFATEAVRNRLAARRRDQFRECSPAELTAASGRRLQPVRAFTGSAIAAVAAPFRLVQRLRPNSGTGLVAVARRPSQNS